MSDDSDIQNKTGKRRKRPLNAASSVESSDSGSPLMNSKRTRKQLLQDVTSDSDDTDSEINDEFVRNLRRKEKVIHKENESSSSENEEIIAIRPSLRPGGASRALSDYESGDSQEEDEGILSDSSGSFSGNEEEEEGEVNGQPSVKTEKDGFECEFSSDSDGQSERCPICLNKFSNQEIGSPEACDHCFCALCIQEWAKNVNTCPVDRQPFTLILVRQHLEGKVIRQIPVNVPTNIQEIPEDATFCEVCGMSDREDRMLLCDSCDHGYHMECLTPPLEYVPIDEWHCPECASLHGLRHAGTRSRSQQRVVEEEDEEETHPRFRPTPRLLPRTRQSERVRTNLLNLNVQPELQQSSGVGESLRGETNRVRRTTATRRTRRHKRSNRRTQTKYRVKRIVTDDGVIEVIQRRKKSKFQKRRKRRTVRANPRSVKERLATKLGMCASRKLARPEISVRQELLSAPINHQRHQAGIPMLDIFGRRDQLEYFSGSDGEYEDGSMEGGVGVLARVRVARPSDQLISRKKAASVLSTVSFRRPLKIEKVAAPAGGSLLDSILDSQTLWHSKKTEIKSNSDGSLQVTLPKTSKHEVLNGDRKPDLKNTTAPVVQVPVFPGGRVSSGTYKPDNSSKGDSSQGQSLGGSNVEKSYEDNNVRTSESGEAGCSRYESSVAPSPLTGMAPIRFRMTLPPRRPNIHSYPTDNIPPPPPLRLRTPLTEISFPATNSPEASPTKDDEEIDIYSDIEQEPNSNDNEEKTFGALEPPPEPPFLMTMEPPPEPPAMLMSLNDDASDDEPSGLVIDDPSAGDAYDPCAVNSDESSAEDQQPLSKPPELPKALKNSELVADYSSDSGTSAAPPYNPELPTYLSTAVIGPLPRPASNNSSEDNDEECPNFSMYSAESMNLAQRELPATILDLDIPIPPPLVTETMQDDDEIPLPVGDSPKSIDRGEYADIPVPENEKHDVAVQDDDDDDSNCEKVDNFNKVIEEINADANRDADTKSEDQDKSSVEQEVPDEERDDSDDEDDDDDDDDEGDNEGMGADDQEENGSESDTSNQEDAEKTVKSKIVKVKGASDGAEDECSTQGDVLDLAIESEANLENNIPPDGHELDMPKSPIALEENDEKIINEGGDKSDGLVDITDEEMSVYDGQDNGDDLEKLDDNILESAQSDKIGSKYVESDDDNSLVGGATSAVSATPLNNSDNIQPVILPGLEGLETETISESEDVNFDELPLEGNEQAEAHVNEEDLSSLKKKKKKKSRKISHTEESTGKGSNEPLEFEEGEIIEDKPKQIVKKDKKIKPKPDVVEIDENVDINKPQKTPTVEKDQGEKKSKKKKDKASAIKDKTEKSKELKEKSIKPGPVDENVSWKKLSKSTKVRNYRDAKEKEERDKDRENRDEELSKRDKRNKEKRKELERYDVRRLISEKPKRPKKDEFGRDISPSKSGSSLSPYRPPRYRSPLRTRNRSRTRSRSWRSRSRGRRRRSRSREPRAKVRSLDRSRRPRSRERSKRRSRSRNKASHSRERRRTLDKSGKVRSPHRSSSRTRRKSRSLSVHGKRRRSLSYSRSWTPSLSRSSISRSRSPRRRRRSRSITRSKSRSWTREQHVSSMKRTRKKDPPKNLTVIVTNKEALKKKDKKKQSKKKDDRRKKKRNQSPAPSKEVFTSGDNILVSVNFKNANKNPELIPASTPLLRESSKRKRDEGGDNSAKKKKTNSSSKKTPGAKKSNRLARINEVTRNAKPVAIIDLDLSPFREQTPSPKEVIILSDSGDEGDKQQDMQDLDHRMNLINPMNPSLMSSHSHSSVEHGQKNNMSQPESPLSTSFMLNTSGPKTPPEPHIKFSINTKPSQIRMLSNPLMEAEEEMQDENIENDVNEILHKGPNTPPEPPPDLNTPASPPTTPYDPFDPTKSRSPSPQPRNIDVASQLNTTREDKLEGMQNDDDNDEHPRLAELRISTPPNELEDLNTTPEASKVHSTPKIDHSNTDASPKASTPPGPAEPTKIPEDTLMKPIQKLLASANKLDVTVHKSPEKLITVVISQQLKNTNQTPKQAIQPLKAITPNKHQTPKGSAKHQLFTSSLLKQVPILGTLPLLPGPPMYTPSLGVNNTSKNSLRIQQNGDPSDDMDIDPSSPYSPGSSEGDDLFEPPVSTPPRNSSKPTTKSKASSGSKFDALFGSSPAKPRHGRHSSKSAKKGAKLKSKGNKKEEVKVKLDEDQLKILDELPSSAVEMQVKDKFLKKLNRQERVVEEVKLVLKPHYAKKHINKEEYKEILRRAVPKICHNKSGEINPIKIQFLIEAYVKKFRYAKKKASGAIPAPTQNKPKPQKTLWS